MTTTPDLINALVSAATPVKPLRHPMLRVVAWLIFAALILAVIAIGHGMRSDLTIRLQQPTFIIATAGSLLTSILAAIASS